MSHMSAIQGALFSDTGKITYILINRANYTISLDLSESAPYTSVATWAYPETTKPLTSVTYSFGILNALFKSDIVIIISIWL